MHGAFDAPVQPQYTLCEALPSFQVDIYLSIYTILLKLNIIIFYDFWFSNVLNVMNTEYMEVDVFYRKKLFAIFKYSYLQ